MALDLRYQTKASNFSRMAVTLVAAFALVAQPMYGLVAGQVATAAPVTQVVYDSLLSTNPPTNYPSTGIQAHTGSNGDWYYEFGDSVTLAKSARTLQTVELTMSSWAVETRATNVTWCASPAGSCTDEGFNYPATLRVYSENDLSNALVTHKQDIFVPWLPADHPHGGIAFNAVFSLTGKGVTLPENVVFSIAYDGRTRGYEPTGVHSPMDAVNVAWRNSSTQVTSVGTDSSPNSMYVARSVRGENPNPPLAVAGWGETYNLSLRVTASVDDRTLPRVELIAPADNSFDSMNTTLTFRATDNVGLDKVVANFRAAGSSTVIRGTQASANGATTYDHNVNLRNISQLLPAGNYTVRYNATDLAGNLSQTANYAFTVVDKTKPVATLATPTTDGPAKDGRVSIQVNANDERGLNLITANIYKDGSLFRSTSTTVRDGAKSATHTATADLPEGAYIIRYNSRDTSNNISATGNHQYVIDMTAPVVTLNNVQKADGSADVVASIEDDNLRHYYLSVTRNSERYNISGAWNTRTTEQFTDRTLVTLVEEGDYTVKLEAVDKAGNKHGTVVQDGDSVKTIDFTVTLVDPENEEGGTTVTESPQSSGAPAPSVPRTPQVSQNQGAPNVLEANTEHSSFTPVNNPSFLNPALGTLFGGSLVDDEDDEERPRVLGDEDRLAQVADEDTTATDGADDEVCGKFLGLCWYWWVVIVAAVVVVGALIRRAVSSNESSDATRGL